MKFRKRSLSTRRTLRRFHFLPDYPNPNLATEIIPAIYQQPFYALGVRGKGRKIGDKLVFVTRKKECQHISIKKPLFEQIQLGTGQVWPRSFAGKFFDGGFQCYAS